MIPALILRDAVGTGWLAASGGPFAPQAGPHVPRPCCWWCGGRSSTYCSSVVCVAALYI